MDYNTILKGKRILIADDEPDVLESLEEILEMCHTDTASSYAMARDCLEKNIYDGAILDIMGIQGYNLLAITSQKGIPTLMLTAHALSSDNFVKSIRQGAYAYIPKEKMSEIDFFLADILLHVPEPPGLFGKWFDRLRPFYDKKFGRNWLEYYKNFWE